MKKIVDQVRSLALREGHRHFITFDEGGGYYDSGYVQPVDFFGDGTRIPLHRGGPRYAEAGGTSRTSTRDHVSILKFIERNWSLPPVTHRSRDNFPNPLATDGNPTCRSTRRRSAICSTCSTSALERAIKLRVLSRPRRARRSQKSAAGTSINVGPEASSAPRTASVNMGRIGSRAPRPRRRPAPAPQSPDCARRHRWEGCPRRSCRRGSDPAPSCSTRSRGRLRFGLDRGHRARRG